MQELMKRRIQWSRIFMIFICLILILGSGLSLFLNLPKEDQSTLKKETVVDNQKTLQNFLTIAIQPVGQTMYVWGGGWNEEDTGAGQDAKRIGSLRNGKLFLNNKLLIMIISPHCIRPMTDWIVPVMWVG